MSAKEIPDSLGITTQKVKRRLNTYYALEIFREDPDYGEYLNEAFELAENISIFFNAAKESYDHSLLQLDTETLIYKIDRHY